MNMTAKRSVSTVIPKFPATAESIVSAGISSSGTAGTGAGEFGASVAGAEEGDGEGD